MRPRFAYILLSAAVLGSCGDALTVEGLAARYEAIEFSGVEEGDPIDLLAAGATLTITLTAAGTTSGRLFVPDAGENDDDLDESMAGTWMLEGTNITFEQDADTFMRDMVFVVEDGRLVGEADFGDVSLRVVLEPVREGDRG